MSQNGQKIHNATVEQEAIPQPVQQRPPRARRFGDIIKWLSISICLLAVATNPRVLDLVTNTASFIPNMAQNIYGSVLFSSFQNEYVEDIPDIEVDIGGFKDSVKEISNFVKIDYTPMYQLSESMTKASRSVSNIKEVASRALSHTNAPQEHIEEILYFFSQLVDEIRATEGTADAANIFYHQHRAELNKMSYFLNSMKRSIHKSNIPGFLDRIDKIIKVIDDQVRDLRRIKRDFIAHKENMQSYNEQSHHLQNEVLEQKDVTYKADKDNLAIKKGAGTVAVLATTAVNPLAGILLGVYGMYYAAEEEQKIQLSYAEFQKAASMLSTTSEVLDGCVTGISLIINNLNEISVNLRQIQEGSNMMMYELGELEGEIVISDDDKEELIKLIDWIIVTTKSSRDKYEIRSH